MHALLYKNSLGHMTMIAAMSIYTPQNNLRTNQLTFPYVVYWVSSVAQPATGSQNKVVPVKKLAFKKFIFILSQICFFLLKFPKIMFYHFIDFLPLPYQWYKVIFSFLTMEYALH